MRCLILSFLKSRWIFLLKYAIFLVFLNLKFKAKCSLKGKCQHEYIVYKIEVYNNGTNNNNNDNKHNNNGKKCKWALLKELSKTVVSHTKYADIRLVYLTMCGKAKRSKEQILY